MLGFTSRHSEFQRTEILILLSDAEQTPTVCEECWNRAGIIWQLPTAARPNHDGMFACPLGVSECEQGLHAALVKLIDARRIASINDRTLRGWFECGSILENVLDQLSRGRLILRSSTNIHLAEQDHPLACAVF